MSYQFLPPLTDAEYEALRADIAANGMRHPILVDEKGKILDGHHRARIAGELGFKPEREVIAGLTETEKRDMAFTLNTARRHMDREQRRAAIVASLKADPQLSDRQHARRTGVSHPTVAGVRSELEASGRLESFTSRRSADGRERPATQPETPARRDPEQLPPEAPVVATPGGPAQDRPSATAEEADGQPASPGPATGPREASAEGATSAEAAGSSPDGDGLADGQPAGDSHSSSEAGEVGQSPSPAAGSSVEVSGEPSTDGEEERRVPALQPDSSDAAGAPAHFPAAGAPDPTDLVNKVLDALVPDDNPHREWQRHFFSDIHALYRVTRNEPEVVAEKADSQCVEELGRALDLLVDYRARVLAALKASLPDNVRQMRRIS